MEHIVKEVDGIWPSTFFAKRSTLDVLQSSKSATGETLKKIKHELEMG